MEPSQELINQMIVAVGIGIAIRVYFGKDGLAPAILAFVFAWKFQQISLGISGGLLFLFLLLKVIGRGSGTPTESKQESNPNIIDVEFEVVEREREQWNR